jgi:5-methyltetrahydropteroyltriglutamate--homocysteine methyltransferase
MFLATKNLPLATTTTGSLPRPSWFVANLAGRAFSAAMADRGFREQYLDAQAVFVTEQIRAGLDVLVDGDARVDDGVAGRFWFAYVNERLEGMGPPVRESQPLVSNRGKEPGDIMYEVIETRMPPSVVGKVARGPLEYDRIWKTSQALTTKPVKFGGISAQLLEAMAVNRFYKDRRDLVLDLADALGKEWHALADAGCPIIQVEEPCIHGTAGISSDKVMTADFYVDAFNREIRGLRDKTEVWCHTCWGSPAAQRTEHAPHSYKDALPYLDRLDVDVLTFECKDRDGADLELIGKHVSKDKKIAIGVVSHRTLQVERPEEVADLVRRALRWIEPERLILTTDCGFGRQGMSRMHAFYKMVAIVRGANIVRRELGLPLAPILAADPRYSALPSGV